MAQNTKPFDQDKLASITNLDERRNPDDVIDQYGQTPRQLRNAGRIGAAAAVLVAGGSIAYKAHTNSVEQNRRDDKAAEVAAQKKWEGSIEEARTNQLDDISVSSQSLALSPGAVLKSIDKPGQDDFDIEQPTVVKNFLEGKGGIFIPKSSLVLPDQAEQGFKRVVDEQGKLHVDELLFVSDKDLGAKPAAGTKKAAPKTAAKPAAKKAAAPAKKPVAKKAPAKKPAAKK